MFGSRSIKEIKPDAALKNLTEEGVIFIDVRTPEEYGLGHAKGAINIPLDVFESEENIEKLKPYKEVYVICQSGGRSAKATSVLSENDINAINISGGTMMWNAMGLPME